METNATAVMIRNSLPLDLPFNPRATARYLALETLHITAVEEVGFRTTSGQAHLSTFGILQLAMLPAPISSSLVALLFL